MAIYFKTTDPQKLLASYKKAIDDGHITTWSYDGDGDFTHTAEQWIRKAWLRPKLDVAGKLRFIILAHKDVPLTSAIYAIYHGRFIESMLRHCDTLFSEASASALPEAGDVI